MSNRLKGVAELGESIELKWSIFVIYNRKSIDPYNRKSIDPRRTKVGYIIQKYTEIN